MKEHLMLYPRLPHPHLLRRAQVEAIGDAIRTKTALPLPDALLLEKVPTMFLYYQTTAQCL
jgi:hypothetical protein